VTSNADHLVEQYLARLERELGHVPRARRSEIVDDISAHIAQARAELPTGDEAAIRNLLDQLGDPAEIAAEAGERVVSPRREGGLLEIVALLLLLVGGLVLPVVGWLAGVVLLWVSEAWSNRDKLIGTLVVPGGLLPAIVLFFGFGIAAGEVCSGRIDSRTGAVIEETCTGGPSTGRLIAGAVLLGLLVVLPLVTTAYLARRMRRTTAAAPA
jgi:hypothetical protein